jgi:hypothetical protein
MASSSSSSSAADIASIVQRLAHQVTSSSNSTQLVELLTEVRVRAREVDNREALGEAIPSIVAILQQNATLAKNTEVIVCGIKALFNVSLDQAANALAVGVNGGLDAVILALTENPNDREVQHVGLMLLVNFAAYNAVAETSSINTNVNRTILVRVGGVQAVAAVLTHWSNDPELSTLACHALWNLYPRAWIRIPWQRFKMRKAWFVVW